MKLSGKLSKASPRFMTSFQALSNVKWSFFKIHFLALKPPQLAFGRSKPSQILLILSMEKDGVFKKILTPPISLMNIFFVVLNPTIQMVNKKGQF